MSSELSSFATLSLNDLVELNCEGIKEKKKKKEKNNCKETPTKRQASNLWYPKGLLQSCQPYTTLGSVPQVWLAGCPIVLRCSLSHSREPDVSPFFSRSRPKQEAGQAGKCHLHGSLKAAVAWALLWLLYRVQGGQSLEKTKGWMSMLGKWIGKHS